MKTIPRTRSLLPFALAALAALGFASPLTAEITLTDETNATLAVSQTETEGDTSENPDVTTALPVGPLLGFTETGTNDYGCCGGRDGTYGLGNLNDGDIGLGVPSDGTYAIPSTGPAMVDITLSAGRAAIGGIAIYNGYGNRDDGLYTLRAGDGTLIAVWSIANTPGAANNGVDSFFLRFKTPVVTDRLIIDGEVADCCGTPSFREIQVFAPSTDSDGDGIPDAYEIANGLNPSVNDAATDLDGDGLSNLQEFQKGTAANLADTDADGLPDGVETGTGTYVSASDTGTNPVKADTDADGLPDGVESRTGTYVSPSNTGTDPFVADTDGDSFNDGVEVGAGFDPTKAASTPAGTSRIRVAVEFQFYGLPGVSYRIEGSPDLETWSVIEANVVGTGGRLSRFYSTETSSARYFRTVAN